jgi:hypothetical protein
MSCFSMHSLTACIFLAERGRSRKRPLKVSSPGEAAFLDEIAPAETPNPRKESLGAAEIGGASRTLHLAGMPRLR